MINLTRIFDAERTAPLVSCSWIELKIVILSTKVAQKRKEEGGFSRGRARIKLTFPPFSRYFREINSRYNISPNFLNSQNAQRERNWNVETETGAFDHEKKRPTFQPALLFPFHSLFSSSSISFFNQENSNYRSPGSFFPARKNAIFQRIFFSVTDAYHLFLPPRISFPRNPLRNEEQSECDEGKNRKVIRML